MDLPKRRALALITIVMVVFAALFVVFRPGDQASAGVDLGDPHAWIEHGLDGELLQINASTGEVTARIDVAEPGESFTAVPHGDGAAVINQDTNAVSLISGTLLSVTNNIALSEADTNENSADVEPDRRIFGSPDLRGNVVVVGDGALISIDPQSRVQTPTALKNPLSAVVQDVEGNVMALAAEDDRVLRLGPRGLGELAEVVSPVDGTTDQRTLIRSGSGTFLVDPSRLSISEVLSDGTYGLPFCTTSAANGAVIGGAGPNDEPLVLGYNPVSSTLNVSSPTDGCFDIDVDVEGDKFGAPVVTKGVAYLPNHSAGRIVVVDIEEERVVANYPFGTRGSTFDLEVVGSTVWANEPQGPFAAIVSSSQITPVPKISTLVAGTAEISEEGDGDALTAGEGSGSGLRIIGNTGERVIASGASDAPQTGTGNGSGALNDDLFGDVETLEPGIEPIALGIEVDASAQPEPDPEPVVEAEEPEVVPEVTETLVANFTVSAGTVAAGEVVRFTDLSAGLPTSWTWDFGDGTGAQEPNVEHSWETNGVFVVTLTVTNATGDQSSQVAEISILPKTVLLAPSADFSFDRNTIEAGESVSFTSRTTGEADLLEWNFGDGDSSVGSSAKHTYDDPGTYTVTLKASNAAGSTTTSTKITVLTGVKPPTAAISPLPAKIVNGQFVTLTSASLNEPTRLSWDLGDGMTASGESVVHSWDSPGTYRVRLTAENSEGSDSTFVDVTVQKRVDPPVSQFTQSATEVKVGEVITFTNLSLNEPTKLIWDFGDITTARGQTATKSWTTPGKYRVTLRATNEAGTNRTGVTITVVKPVDPPVASFADGATLVAPGQRLEFQDTSSNNPTSWAWDFGDGGTSSIAKTAHEWAKAGTYTVRLTVSNEGGSSTAVRQIVVKAAPSANFRWEVVEGTTVKFTDTSWDEPTTYRWDFGDGNTSTERSPTHTFGGGAFDVTLVVSNDAGTSAPKTQKVTTIDPPIARPTCEARGPFLDCTAVGSPRATGFTWSADGAVENSTPNQPTTTFSFKRAGRKSVTLIVSNAAGVTDTVTIESPRVSAGRAPRVTSVDVKSNEGDQVRLVATFDRSPTSWEWSVEGAELIADGDTASPLFRVPRNGVFSGKVQVKNPFGQDTDTFDFEAEGFTTEASFTWKVVRPGEVRFRNKSNASADAEYEWRFAGGPEILDDNFTDGPLVRYPDAGGTFRVVLVVTDENGRSVYRENIVVPPIEPEPPEPPEDPDEDDVIDAD